jgi:prepilin-type N-terminal cleavage/methylation domain-containing protein
VIKSNKQTGFTLVELMIATVVFAVVIMVGMYGFIQISRFYTKSISIIRTQEAARNLMMDIANQFQLTSGVFNKHEILEGGDGRSIICVGNKAYVYKINSVETSSNHALSSYLISPDTCPTRMVDLSDPNPINLLRPGARIIQLNITPYPNATTGPLFNITVAVLYAPIDNATPQGTDLIQVGTTPDDPNYYNTWFCSSAVRGSEYCSLSRLTTSVYKRVQAND